MNTKPEQHASNGRFLKNNAGGPGNPFGGRVSKLRKMLLESMTDEDMQKLVDKLIEIALEGNLSAIKLVLAYTIGKPGAAYDAIPFVCDEPATPAPEKEAAATEFPMVGDLTKGLDLSSLPEILGKERPRLASRSPLANGVFSKAADIAVVTEKGDEPGEDRPPAKQKSAKKRR